MGHRLLPKLACLAVLARAEGAFAYSTDSVVSDGCHELITMRALRAARAEQPALAPLPPDTRDDRALLDDLPFGTDSDMRDLGAATLLLGNRSNDLHDNEPDDLDRLALVHADPDDQAAHCLRRPEHDGQPGIEQAVAECRDYIREQIALAVQGLTGGVPDADQRAPADVFLELRGAVEAPLPVFYFRAGKALHALQDSFSHAYRTSDQLRIVTPLNYVEWSEDELDEARDGPPHKSELDRCQDLDALRSDRLTVAQHASADLLRAAVSGGADGALDELFATYLSACDASNGYCGNGAPCDFSNGWCGAPESRYAESRGCVCSAAGAGAGAGAPWFAPLLLLGLVSLFARRPARCAAGLSLALVAAGGRARAQEALPEPAPPSAEPPAPAASPPPVAEPEVERPDTARSSPPVLVDAGDTSAPVVDATPVSEQRKPFPLGVAASFGVALENPALAFALGARLRLGDHWLIGLDGEYNPWISFQHDTLRSGTVNVYATGILRFPLAFQRVNLRTTVQAGVSRQMFDLFGVPEGSVGPYFGVNFLGLDIELTRSVYLVIDPAHIAVPIPQTSGVPFSYPQYRFTIGVQLGA